MVSIYQSVVEGNLVTSASTLNSGCDASANSLRKGVNQQRPQKFHQELDEQIKKHPSMVALVSQKEKKGKSS